MHASRAASLVLVVALTGSPFVVWGGVSRGDGPLVHAVQHTMSVQKCPFALPRRATIRRISSCVAQSNGSRRSGLGSGPMTPATATPEIRGHGAAVGFVGALDREELRSLRGVAVTRRFRKGQALFHQGASSDRVVVLLGGRVKVSTVTEEGKEIVLAFRGPGD